MKKQDLEFLTSLYNNLLLIHTSGEDTIRIADNLKELYRFIMNAKQDYEDELANQRVQEMEE